MIITEKENLLQNHNYTDEYKRRSECQEDPDWCKNCSYFGTIPSDNHWLCCENPYKLVMVSYCGHCDGFTRQAIDFNKLQKLFLKLNGFEFKHAHSIKTK